jgi:hypothetical protein
MSDERTTIDLDQEAEGIITRAVNAAVPHIPEGVLLLHWRVHKELNREIAKAMEAARAKAD